MDQKQSSFLECEALPETTPQSAFLLPTAKLTVQEGLLKKIHRQRPKLSVKLLKNQSGVFLTDSVIYINTETSKLTSLGHKGLSIKKEEWADFFCLLSSLNNVIQTFN